MNRQLLHLHVAALASVEHDLKTTVISLNEGTLLSLACRKVAQLARSCVDDGLTSSRAIGLKATSLLRSVGGSVNDRLPTCAPPSLGKLDGTLPTIFPLFGWIARDLDEIEALAGDDYKARLVRPLRLSAVPDRVGSYDEALVALDQACRQCSLISHQADRMQNAYACRAALVEHLFTETLPAPLPPNTHSSGCFWLVNEMNRATQVELLRLLHLCARHYSTAVLSMQQTETSDAARLLILACICAIADAVCRRCDGLAPSSFCLHYSGAAPGPGQPFGFELGGFRADSAFMKFYEPRFVARRTQA